jgi:hypothetical protein
LLRTDPASHHSWTIKYISDTGIPFLIFSSRPAKTVLFTRYEYPTTGFTFPNGLNPETEAGFLAFRQPQDLLKPVWDVPGYSLEQYDIPIKKWAKTVQNILKLADESFDEIVVRQLNSICDGARDRVIYVNDAIKYMNQVHRCFDAVEYDDMSSPSRDARLFGSINDLRATYANLSKKNLLSKLSGKVLNELQQVVEGADGDYCLVKISSKTTITLNDIIQGFDRGWISSNPHDSLAARWGLTDEHSELALSCPVY